tara:strand:+ start:371 stop:589 length:219 start_codon:yes stop_codon:yes gene_type:complete
MPKNQDLSELQIIKIIEEAAGSSSKDFFDYLNSAKAGKGPKFTADSKGGVKKNYKNGGAILSGRGGKFKGVF